MLQFDEYKVKLNNIKPSLDELSQALDLPAAERELDMLNSESAAPGFWDDLEKSQKVTRRMRQLENKLEAQRKRESQWDDLVALCEMGNEFEDESLVPELEEGFAKLEEEILKAREEAEKQAAPAGPVDEQGRPIIVIEDGEEPLPKRRGSGHG